MALNIPTPDGIRYFTGYNGSDVITIVPSNSVTIAADTTNNPRGYQMAWLWATTAGNAVVIDPSGVQRTLTGLTLWQMVPFPVRQVLSTGTTASFLGIISK